MGKSRLGIENRRSNYYDRISNEAFDQRWEKIYDLMREQGLDSLIVYGDGGFHQAKTHYLTNYRPPFTTYLVIFADPDTEATLFAGISNHLQYIREVSEVDDIRLLLPNPPTTVIDRLSEAGVDDGQIGLVTDDPRYNITIPHTHYQRFTDELDADFVDVSDEYTRITGVHGEEELELVEQSAEILDEVMEATEAAIEPGLSERDLRAVMQQTAHDAGATLGSDFITSVPVENAERGEAITWHEPSNRQFEQGDVVTTEISVDYKGYMSQIHRPYIIQESLTEQYEKMFNFAKDVYDRTIDTLEPGNTVQDVHQAVAPIEKSKYKIYDVLVHGYGRSYRHPFIGTNDSNYWPGAEDDLTADWTFEPGMVIVVQPNVVTLDERECLQFGTTVIIREKGADVLQEYPTEFHRV